MAGVGDELAQPGPLSWRASSAEPTWSSTGSARSHLADLGGRIGVGHPFDQETSPRSAGSALTRAAVAATRSNGRSSRRTMNAPASRPDNVKHGDHELGGLQTGHVSAVAFGSPAMITPRVGVVTPSSR